MPPIMSILAFSGIDMGTSKANLTREVHGRDSMVKSVRLSIPIFCGILKTKKKMFFNDEGSQSFRVP